MNIQKTLMTILGFSLLTGCSFSISSPSTPPPPTPTQLAIGLPTQVFTETPVSIQPTSSSTSQVFTALPTFTLTSPPLAASTSAPGSAPNVCTDPQVTTLINSLKSAMLNADGELLSSIVHPSRGIDVRYFRDGNVVHYTAEQAKFLFETTFEADWGAEPGSGQEKTGSFHDVVVPKLVDVFNTSYTLHCNELKHGGATYELKWPYQGDFYSIYYAGSEQYGNMDWNTWAVGIDYVNGKPFLYALMQFFWEP
jgi:hypothetical protein